MAESHRNKTYGEERNDNTSQGSLLQEHQDISPDVPVTALVPTHQYPPPPEMPFKIKFRTSLFSKYKECVIKPMPPKPKPNQTSPTPQEPLGLVAKSSKTSSSKHPQDKQSLLGQNVDPNAEWSMTKQHRQEHGIAAPAHVDGGPFLEVKGWEGAEMDVGVAEGRKPRRRGSRLDRRRGSSSRRKRRGSAWNIDEDDILQMYGEDGELAEGDPEGLDTPRTLVEQIEEQKEMMEDIKYQPWPIAKKLQVLSLAKSFVVKHEGRLSRGHGYQQKGRQLLKQIKRSWNNFEYWMTPWEMRIKRIESHFGSVVTSYFIFLRWLLWINLWLTVAQVCFVIVPEMLVGPEYGTTDRKTIPEDDMDTAYDLKTIWDAEGVMRYSPLFYGYYGNAVIIGNGYRLPLAYLMTTLVSFAYSFIVVLKKMASNSRQSRLSNKDEQFTFSWKLFTDWDFMVGNTETANTKHASIVTTMKEAIVEEQEKKQEEKRYLIIFLRVLSNVIVVMLLALSTYIIQLFVERSRELELAKLEVKDHDAGFWAENELTIIMTMISTLFPNVLDLIALMEKYHPRTTLRLQLARIFLLNLINLYTLFIALYNKQSDLKAITLKVAGESVTNTSLCRHISSTNSTTTAAMTTTTTNSITTATTFTSGISSSDIGVFISTVTLRADSANTESATRSSANTSCTLNGTSVDLAVDFCWETMIGQEVFKLTVMDLIFTLGQIFIIDVFRSLFIKYCNSICCWDLEKKFPEYPDFKTAENLLHLINNQGVIWLGVFFSPGLAVLNLLKLLLLMYMRCWTVLTCNVPQERIFRASRSNNFYFALLLIMLFLCMLPPLFAIVGIEPSPTCGPFSGLDQIFHVLTRTMDDELPASINSVLEYVASPGVIVPIFMLLAMTIYYLVSVGRSLRDANNELRMMLEYERTEGRKKVYAMADAKRDLEQPDGKKRGKENRMANAGKAKLLSGFHGIHLNSLDIVNKDAVSSVLKAAQMAKAFTSGLGLERGRKPNHTSGLGPKKMAPAVRPKPYVPVAVVQGKRSLRKSAAVMMNRARAVRRPQQQQRRVPMTANDDTVYRGTNGRMVTASDSGDTHDFRSNDDDDDMSSASHPSSHSSAHSVHMHDDSSVIVDDTGHLRPVTEDDVFLEMESSSEDEENNDDYNNPNEDDYRVDGGGGNDPDDDFEDEYPELPATAIPMSRIQHRQDASTLNVMRRSRPPPPRTSRKIQPAEIPKITVVDFGEGSGTADEQQKRDESSGIPVETLVIVENENAKKTSGQNRMKKLGLKVAQKTRRDKRSGQSSSPLATDEEHSAHSQTKPSIPSAAPSSSKDHTKQSGSCEIETVSTSREVSGSDVSKQNTQGKSSKTRFSNILARFQRMDGSG